MEYEDEAEKSGTDSYCSDIRNSLQVIELATHFSDPGATVPVREAIDVIEGVLKQVLIEARPAQAAQPTQTGTPIHS